MKQRLAAINCTSCGGALDLRGGHRVRSVTCGYCGAVMDAHEDFNVIAQYKDMPRPYSPIEIGMSGQINDVEFSVIGTIGYSSVSDFVWYHWVSHQIFSATHGYAWLTFNEGHFIFSRRVRMLPQPPLISHFHEKMTISVDGQLFKAFEQFKATIDFVEGELTWAAKLHEATLVIEAIAPPRAFEYEIANGEIEYSMSEYLPREQVIESFGLDPPPAPPRDVHPAQPFIIGSLSDKVAKLGYVFTTIAAAALIFTAIFGSGSQVASGDLQAGVRNVDFQVSRPAQLVELELNAAVDNNWTYLEIEIYDDEDQPVIAGGREIGYYHGYDDGNWYEGSRNATLTFKVPAAGNYTMEIGYDPESQVKPPVRYAIREGVMPLRYMSLLLLLSGLAAASVLIRRLLFERRRWGDDDD